MEILSMKRAYLDLVKVRHMHVIDLKKSDKPSGGREPHGNGIEKSTHKEKRMVKRKTGKVFQQTFNVGSASTKSPSTSEKGMAIKGSNSKWQWNWEQDVYVTSEGKMAKETRIEKLSQKDIDKYHLSYYEKDGMPKKVPKGSSGSLFTDPKTGTVLGIMVENENFGAWMFSPKEWKNVDWEQEGNSFDSSGRSNKNIPGPKANWREEAVDKYIKGLKNKVEKRYARDYFLGKITADTNYGLKAKEKKKLREPIDEIKKPIAITPLKEVDDRTPEEKHSDKKKHQKEVIAKKIENEKKKKEGQFPFVEHKPPTIAVTPFSNLTTKKLKKYRDQSSEDIHLYTQKWLNENPGQLLKDILIDAKYQKLLANDAAIKKELMSRGTYSEGKVSSKHKHGKVETSYQGHEKLIKQYPHLKFGDKTKKVLDVNPFTVKKVGDEVHVHVAGTTTLKFNKKGIRIIGPEGPEIKVPHEAHYTPPVKSPVEKPKIVVVAKTPKLKPEVQKVKDKFKKVYDNQNPYSERSAPKKRATFALIKKGHSKTKVVQALIKEFKMTSAFANNMFDKVSKRIKEQ